MLGLDIARRKHNEVINKIDKKSNSYQNALNMPLAFYLENTVEEAINKLNNGICEKAYTVPSNEVLQSLIDREERAEICRLRGIVYG